MTVRASAANPRVLTWARLSVGLSIDDVAERIDRPPELIEAWESGDDSPTFNQLEYLASTLYKRPVAVFFFPDPPEVENVREEFRTLPQAEFEKLEPDTWLALREARAYQLSLEELAAGGAPAERLILRDVRASVQADVQTLAADVRSYLRVPLQEQQSWPNPAEAFKAWRDAVEDAGVFVFKRACEQDSVSGFCIHDERYPIVLINNSTPHTRQIFTLFHELAHLLFGVSSITTTDVHFEDRFIGPAKTIEVRCNRFAGEFLLPASAFPWDVFEREDLDRAVEVVASRFNVSREVVLRKVFDAGLIDSSAYEAQAGEWTAQAQEARSASGSGGNYYANQVTYLGNAFLRLGFEQLRAGNVSLADLADHFAMKASTVSKLEQYVLGRSSS